MTTEIAEYSATDQALAGLTEKYKGVVYDVTTTKGMDAAKEGRAELRMLRTTLEKRRQELKAPILERGKLLDSEAKRITAAIEDLEGPIDEQIKREEKRKEDERQRKLREEEERIRVEQAELDKIRSFPLKYIGKPSAEIGTAAKMLGCRDLSIEFGSHIIEHALGVRGEAVTRLLEMHKAAELTEQQAAENERLRAQEREAEKVRQREAEEQRERERAAALEREHIEDIRRIPLDCIGATAVRLAMVIEDARSLTPAQVIKDPERLALAETAKSEVVAWLQQMLSERETLDTIAKDKADRERMEAEQRRQAEEAAQRAQDADRLAELRKSAPPLRDAAVAALSLLSELAPNHDTTLTLGFAIERADQRRGKPKTKPEGV